MECGDPLLWKEVILKRPVLGVLAVVREESIKRTARRCSLDVMAVNSQLQWTWLEFSASKRVVMLVL